MINNYPSAREPGAGAAAGQPYGGAAHPGVYNLLISNTFQPDGCTPVEGRDLVDG